jgi:hypothetical protein
MTHRSAHRRYGESVTRTPLSTYYDGIQALSDRLFSAGALDWAEALTAAMKDGATPGEILSNTGVVLRNLAESPELRRSKVEEEVARLQVERESLWQSGGH